LAVEWRYIRSSGLPFSARLLPAFLRRGRRTETRTGYFHFASTEYRARLAEGWASRGREDLAHRVDV